MEVCEENFADTKTFSEEARTQGPPAVPQQLIKWRVQETFFRVVVICILTTSNIWSTFFMLFFFHSFFLSFCLSTNRYCPIIPPFFLSFVLLIHEESHREVYQEFQPSYNIFRRWCQGLFRPQVPFCINTEPTTSIGPLIKSSLP